MKGIADLTLLLASVLCAFAQTPVSADWQGEWGSFAASGRSGSQLSGRSVHIWNCQGDVCQIEITCQEENGHCEGSGELHVGTSSAVLKPPPGGAEPDCQLTLRLLGNGSKSTIEVKMRDGDCSYFCTPRIGFEGSFPLRSREAFYGSDLPACFLGQSAARMAICQDKVLADQEKLWIRLSDEVSGLLSSPVTRSPETCDSSADAAQCVRALIDSKLAGLQNQKNTWLASVSEPGDPKEAAQKLAQIVGQYRHSFQNGDVQGDKFKSINTVEIRRASDTSIDFTAHLEFFNGHECSEAGTAEFKRGGFFVFHGAEKDQQGCFLEIIPTAAGIQFADPTGKCREYDCGERGGWNGAEFLFSERVKPKR